MDPFVEPATVADPSPSASIVSRWQLAKAYVLGSIFQALLSLLPLYRLTRWKYGWPPGIVTTHERIKTRGGHSLKLIILQPGVRAATRPKGVKEGGPLPVIINAHGSGFVLPCHGTDVDLLAETAARLGICAIDADYRHSPRHSFPSPIEDLVDVIKWVRSQPHRFDPDRIVMSGFSAGGNIVMGATAILSKEADQDRTTVDDLPVLNRQDSIPVPADQVLRARPGGSKESSTGQSDDDVKWDAPGPIAGLVLFYPPTDLSIGPWNRPPAPCQQVAVGISTSGQSRRWLDGCYLRTKADQEDWRASPIKVGPRSWPRVVWIACGDADPLWVQADAFISKLKSVHHPDVNLYTAPRMAHAWDKLAKVNGLGWSERKEAYRQYIQAVERAITPI
ncbi:hypothetical protein OC846_004086 [Tilletia horrida]|uniref:Alpha/beta hydrolase fold-3 domain-containing protein n=1 Tax=Tilletia horrida TaxID=155126 RepID=A0AAN6GNE6_9BASI|nr:hypothetical protein OC846_004086 [Tilletia horrida]